MKYSILILLTSCLSIFKTSAENNLQIIESNITAVTLFFNEAQVFRKAKVQVDKGINTIQIKAISPYIVKESLKISTNPLVAINGIALEIDEATNEKNRSLTHLDEVQKDSLNMLQDSIKFYQSYHKILEQQQQFITQNRLNTNNIESGLPHNLTDFQKNLPAYEQKYIELENKIIANLNMTNALKKRSRNLKNQNRWSKLQKNKTKSAKLSNLSYQQINLVIQSEKAQTIDIEIDYLIKNATWEPVYDIVFSSYENQPKIIYKAKFHQNTGENWKDVKLTYSTAKPTSDKQLPEFKSTYLDYFKNNKKQILIKPATTKWEKGKADPNALSSNPEDAMVMCLVDVPAEYQAIKNIQTDLNLSYILKNKISVETFEAPQFQYLKEALFDANYLYRVLPYLNYKVYKVAKIADWQKLNLLSGTANIYADKVFIGQVDIITNKISGDLEFALGVDNAIVVSREKQTVSSNKKWLDMKRKDELGYQINLQNNRPQEIQVEVIEQIPLSKQSDIEVNMIKHDEATYDETSGKLTWLLDIPAKAKLSKAFAYEIVYPKDKFIGFE